MTSDPDEVGKIENTEAEWRIALGPEQYRVCREHGTEPAFSGRYHDTKDPGHSRCGACGADLFDDPTGLRYCIDSISLGFVPETSA